MSKVEDAAANTPLASSGDETGNAAASLFGASSFRRSPSLRGSKRSYRSKADPDETGTQCDSAPESSYYEPPVRQIRRWYSLDDLDRPYQKFERLHDFDEDDESVSSNGKRTLGGFGCFWIFLCTIYGIAPITFPYTVLQIGAYGWFCTISIMLLVQYFCATLTKECAWVALERLRDDKKEDYRRDMFPFMAELAGGLKARFFVIWFFCVCLLAAALGFMLTTCEIMNGVYSFPAMSIYSSLRCWICIFCIVTLPISYLGYFRELVSVAFIGVFATSVMLIVSIICSSLIYVHVPPTKLADPHPEVTPQSVFTAFGTMMFACSGIISLLPNTMTEMKHREKTGLYLTTPHIVIFILYLVSAYVPYFLLRGNVNADITSSYVGVQSYFPYKYEKEFWYYTPILLVGRLSLGLHCTCVFILFMNPVFQHIEEGLGVPTVFCWQRIVIRTTGMVFMCGFGLAIPYFAPVVSLVGGVILTFLVTNIPIAIYYKIYDEYIPIWKKACMMVVLITSWIFMVGCFATQIKDLVSIWTFETVQGMTVHGKTVKGG